MDQMKVNAILSALEAQGIPQIIISDPVVIFYLTGAKIQPGERLLALYLNVCQKRERAAAERAEA